MIIIVVFKSMYCTGGGVGVRTCADLGTVIIIIIMYHKLIRNYLPMIPGARHLRTRLVLHPLSKHTLLSTLPICHD